MVKAEILSGPFVEQPLVLDLDRLQPADARTENHAAAPGVFLREVDARIAHGVDAGDLGELDEAIEALDVLGLDVAVGRPIADFAAEADAVIGHIQPFERTDSALAVADASPELLHLAAERGDGADTRDDDAAFHASSQAEDASVLSTAF